MFDTPTPRRPRQDLLLTHQPIPLKDWIRERLRGFELRQKQRNEARRQKNENNRRRHQ
jgi:hypothetical protein